MVHEVVMTLELLIAGTAKFVVGVVEPMLPTRISIDKVALTREAMPMGQTFQMIIEVVAMRKGEVAALALPGAGHVRQIALLAVEYGKHAEHLDRAERRQRERETRGNHAGTQTRWVTFTCTHGVRAVTLLSLSLVPQPCAMADSSEQPDVKKRKVDDQHSSLAPVTGLLIKRLSEKAKLPTRGSALAAGYDLYR